MKKICGNCFCWKAKADEPNMGHCFRSSGGKKKHRVGKFEPVENGISIRYTPFSTITEVVFGKNFGCRYYKKP